jgi:hypothetical protein
MTRVDDGRKLDVTDVLETEHGTFVVTGVQYQDLEEGHGNFTYQIKDPADLIVDEPEEEE